METGKNLSGEDLERMKIRLKFFGSSDTEMRKAIVYRENYMKEMEKYQNFQNYDKLLEKMKSIKNPLQFYNHIKDNLLVSDLTYQSDEYYSQSQFDEFLEMWGVRLTKKIEETEFYEEGMSRRYYYEKERKGEFEDTL